jgi:hypothetical protein
MKMLYVSMTDKFLSGWGMAERKINKLIIECETMAEARIVVENAENRSEMKYINIVHKKPYYSSSRYLTSYHDKTDYDSWFVQGYFKK